MGVVLLHMVAIKGEKEKRKTNLNGKSKYEKSKVFENTL